MHQFRPAVVALGLFFVLVSATACGDTRPHLPTHATGADENAPPTSTSTPAWTPSDETTPLFPVEPSDVVGDIDSTDHTDPTDDDENDDSTDRGSTLQAVPGTSVLVATPLDTAAARTAREHYIAFQLERRRAVNKAPAMAAALVLDGATVAAAVSGQRRVGSPAAATIDDAFMLKSCTKPMTGYLVARVIAQHLPISTFPIPKTFDWTTRILDVFPELGLFAHPAYHDTTVLQLMTHSSGMPYMPNHEGPDEFAGPFGSSLTQRRYKYTQSALMDPPLSPSPYGGGSIIVAAMLEHLTGKSWETLMQAYVYDDIGMTNSGVGSSPYPVNALQVSSHVTASSGAIVPWFAPPGYASEPHAPAGRNPHASILDFARFASANSPTATHRAGSLPQALVNTITTLAQNDHTPSGWGLGARYSDPAILWHNGSDGHDYSLAYVSKAQNFATVVMANLAIGDSEGNIISDELVALRGHYAMVNAFDKRKAATATGSASRSGYPASAASDGSFVSRWESNSNGGWLTLDFGSPQSITHVRIGEYGSAIAAYVIEADQGGTWVEVKSGTTVGPNRAVSFSSTITRLLRLRVTSAPRGHPSLSELWAY